MRVDIKLEIFLIFLAFIGESNHSEISNSSLSKKHKRALGALFHPVLLFPYNACSGILVAIAVPLVDIDRNVFVSYNFEANYNMPNVPSDSIPGPLKRFPGLVPEDLSLPEAREMKSNDTQIEEKKIGTKIQLTRKGIYQMIESRLRANGIDGKKCWLRSICEASKHSFLESNGVLGHLIHILLTPSSSMNENFPSEYTKAEKAGRAGNCIKYEKKCQISILEGFSKLF